VGALQVRLTPEEVARLDAAFPAGAAAGPGTRTGDEGGPPVNCLLPA